MWTLHGVNERSTPEGIGFNTMKADVRARRALRRDRPRILSLSLPLTPPLILSLSSSSLSLSPLYLSFSAVSLSPLRSLCRTSTRAAFGLDPVEG